jgi:hypothetical protein
MTATTTTPARFAEWPRTTEGGNCVAKVIVPLPQTGATRREAMFLLRVDGTMIQYVRYVTEPWSIRPRCRVLRKAPKSVTPETFEAYAIERLAPKA